MFRKSAMLLGLLLPGVLLAQNVVVNPTGNQNIVQPAGTSLNDNTFNQIRYYTASDNWTQSPSSPTTLTAGSSATVTLAPCPTGIYGTDALDLVYISTVGTPEAVQMTGGGSCTPGSASGTITFTPLYSHGAGYTIGSASSGIQEAITDACGVPINSGGNGDPNCHVVLPPTGATASAISVHGSIYVHCSGCLLEGDGTLLNCSTRDRCMVLGDLVSTTSHYGNLTVRGIRFESAVSVSQGDGCQVTNTQRQTSVVTITVASGCSTIQTGDLVNINFTDSTAYWGSHGPVTVSGTLITYSQVLPNIASVASPGTIAIQNAVVEDNALPGIMDKLEISGAGSGNFNEGLVIDNDQAATIRNLNYTPTSTPSGLLCDANHCGSAIYSAGNTSASPVIWVDKANLSMQCAGNGITSLANNTVHVTDSVIQGFGMWGVYTSTILGSYGGTQLDNVYNEEGAGPCPNPYLGNTFASAGIIYSSGGEPLSVRGGEQPNGWMPEFANTGTTTQYNYYVVVHDSSVAAGGTSYPLYAGYAMSNGSGNITVQWPHVAPIGTVTYDLVRMTPGTLAGNSAVFPVQGACGGGSPTACGIVAPLNLPQCSGLVCSYTDNAGANTSSYSITSPTYFPMLTFWPGGLVMNGTGTQNAGNLPGAVLDTDWGVGNPISSPWISTAGFLRPTIYARQCSGNAGAYGGAWVQCLEGDGHGNGFPEVGSLLLNSGPNAGAETAGVKGRLNFITSPADDINQLHIITLVDSNPAKTLATSLNRPGNDAADTYIGLDQPAGGSVRSAAQLAFGAPVAISNYIANAGDNTNWGTRLNSSSFAIGTRLNQRASANFAGTCVFMSSTSCMVTYSSAFNSIPVVIITPVMPGSVTFRLNASSISSFTIAASSSNTVTVNWIAIGNPN